MRHSFLLPLFLILAGLCLPGISSNSAFASESPAEMSQEDAAKILQDIEGEVLSVERSELPGFYRVAMQMQGRVVPLYLDNSGKFLFSGNIIDLQQRRNLTEEHFRQLNPVAIDKIPLDENLSIGSLEAPDKIIVFTDPNCPFCSQLHQVLPQAVKANPRLVFHIKLIPLKDSSYQTAKTIICNQSLEQLERAFAGKNLPVTDCQTEAIENNLALAQSLGIRGTPTLVLPNGQISPGYRPLEELLKLIKENKVEPK
ncbi:MAG: DsbC family protein [Deltaproteobacteria bacterium]|jgi:thiol:disulfide interchange protein DsbC|nr:DsbC family protein [Deltaproteobacteria bacterium]MCW8893834.1 DsbC family protein [Deltaproteobacteria bacterium]MCW9049230.1 DsbC family protein [Deltaproteobacteria bacterium]